MKRRNSASLLLLSFLGCAGIIILVFLRTEVDPASTVIAAACVLFILTAQAFSLKSAEDTGTAFSKLGKNVRSRSLELSTYIANILSEQVARRNGFYQETDRMKFWPISLVSDAESICVRVSRKEIVSGTRELDVVKVRLHIADAPSAVAGTLRIIRPETPDIGFSLIDLDKFLAEAKKIVKEYQLPE